MVCLGELLVVLLDVGRGSDLLLAHGYLQPVGANLDLS
jgi:hypothetical protein